ncbi:tyrosine-type recombinase/integrase [Conexibacter sp. JD483]|uniref:site-specific integrase n=1 Tax=unclassified Conexibacter TaxID=2627773 RepID=UPI00271FB2AB|nr:MULTISPECIES: site-specific integrase [unclassified Conexibacter]MDO8183977.1 tyrosine-type recombinase/integrase [Conexibacter sp. CPCC 205706]MDO8196969.1 tyrosine-type recombinase/integrase [Conexibacter sp. CPCC 205762]MDR9369061.1 tyrosine-type recombinase/integrase [Conexibacter sp. JD483]
MTGKTVGRPVTGEILRAWRKRDRQYRYALRFPFVHPDTGERDTAYIVLGLETEGWNEPLARQRLDECLEEARAGVYRPPAPKVPVGDRDPKFHVYSSSWLAEKRPELSRGAYADYRNLLVNHLLPYFSEDFLTEINHDRIKGFRTNRLEVSRKLHDAKQAGVPLTTINRRGRRVRKRLFGARQINASIKLLGRIMASAIKSESYDVDRQHARDPEFRVKRKRPDARRHLEADEVVDLLAGALELDNPVSPATIERARLARQLRDEERMQWALVGKALDCAPTQAMWLYRRQPHPFPPRSLRSAIAMLTLAGGRNQEIAARIWEQVDFSHHRLVVPTSKSRPREIEMSPFLVEEMMLYLHSLPTPPTSRDLVLATRDGRPRSRNNLNANVLGPVVQRANERRLARGAAPLPPRITPQTLRRSFVTMSAQRGKSLSWIVYQVGHSTYTTTLRYYQEATATETLPHIAQCLDVLFAPRPVVGLDQFDQLVAMHDLEHFIGTIAESRVSRPAPDFESPDLARPALALAS